MARISGHPHDEEDQNELKAGLDREQCASLLFDSEDLAE
jgi:hypothetical protein